MLAGRIKLRSFLAILVGVACGGVIVMVKACKSSDPPPKPSEVVKKTPDPVPTPPDPTPTPRPMTPAHPTLEARAWDAEVIAWGKKTISGDKQKDVSKGKPYKINVYKDAGKTTVNRVKVDINRNDKFDEKITFDGDTITLEVAPADDEKYTKTYHWTGTGWLPEGAEQRPLPGATAEAPPTGDTPTVADGPKPANDKPSNAKVDLPERDYDKEVLVWKDKSIPGDKEKDVSKGKPYKINVYKDAGQTNVNRAKVDINRNDKFDEKYTFEPGKITLQRAPADDEQYTETYHWSGGGWVKK